jgi:hypothetical protein
MDGGEAMLIGFTAAMSRILGFIPALLGAILVFAIGWFVGALVGKGSTRALRSLGFQRFSERIGLSDFLLKAGVQRTDASAVMGAAACWVIRLVFLQIAAETVGLTQITTILNAMIAFIPNIVVALLILMVAGFLGRLLQGVARGAAAKTGSPSANLLGDLAYWSVFAFGIIAALNQLSIAPMVVNTLFIGLVATLVLSLGLSFGLGGREVAAELTRSWADRAKGLAPQVREQLNATYNDPLTRPHPSEYEEEPPSIIQATSTTPMDTRRSA